MQTLTVDFTDGRQRPADYINICRNMADSYPFGIAHGIQKDAIQNGLDAVVGKKPLRFTFELVETAQGRFLTMTDAHTSGLTGAVRRPEEYDELGPEDHWARFESFAFTKKDPDAIGARGQGKFIFLAGSKQGLMFYDSLRNDGSYRLGVTQANRVGCPLKHWDEEQARKILREKTSLEPLSETGTRIVIVDPIDELVEEIKRGSFTQAIQETWFRAIEKGRVEIRVKTNDQETLVKVPEPFPVVERDSPKFKTWVRDSDVIDPVKGEKFRIKHLRIVRKTNERVPEHLRGIAVVHNDMKITSIDMNWAPANIRESIFGYVEFDQALDRELRKNTNQDPNHYELKWRQPVPRAIKCYLQEQLREFGIQKLGIGIDPRERKKRVQSAAEEWAMRRLTRFAHDLDLFGAKGIARPPTEPPPPPTTKKKGVILSAFAFPEPERAPRVNWGESVQGFRVSIFNKTGSPFSAQLKVMLLFGDRVLVDLENQGGLNVPGRGSLGPFGPYSIEFKKSAFPNPGVYKLRVRLIDEHDKSEIDALTRKIYLEKEPELRVPFGVMGNSGFDVPHDKRQWLATGELGHDPVLFYNTHHPAYARVESEDDEDKLGCYLFEVFLEGSVDYILGRPDREDGSPDFHPLDGKRIKGDPKDAYDEVIAKISEIKARFYEEL